MSTSFGKTCIFYLQVTPSLAKPLDRSVIIAKSTTYTMIIVFQNIMKTWRKCSLCPVTSYSRPDLVIFSTKTSHQTSTVPATQFVCELHFQPEDMRAHQDSKRYTYKYEAFFQTCNFRLVSGATPSVPAVPNPDHFYSRQEATTEVS